MNEQTVRAAIDDLIERKEKRISVLEAESKGIQEDTHPIRFRVNREDIRCLNHSIDTLIELQHNLRLCNCPDSAYQQKEMPVTRTWDDVIERVEQAAKCASGLEAPTRYSTTPLSEWVSDDPAMCCVCGANVARKQCAGCKCLFCNSCFETHIQDNKRFLDPDVKGVQPQSK